MQARQTAQVHRHPVPGAQCPACQEVVCGGHLGEGEAGAERIESSGDEGPGRSQHKGS